MKNKTWFSVGASALIFWVISITQGTSQTTIFSDDFNSGVIDANKWTTSGNTVVESGGVMQVLTTVTDQGGVLTSVPVPISAHGDITITRSAFLHYANEYFVGSMLVKFGSLGWAGVNYANYFYPSTYYGWEDRYGIYLSRSNVGGWPPFISSSSDTDISEPFSPIWDTWFNEKLVYSPDTGNLRYFINGQKMADYFIGVMPATSNPTIQFQFRAWGWWTGHEQLFDNFVVTQNETNGCDKVTLNDLLTEVKACRNLGLIDNNGIANSLTQKLNNANSASSNGNTKAVQNILKAFVNEVSAQAGKHIQSDAASLLIGDARCLE